MPSCQECGTEAEFLFTCRECGERFCAAHVDSEDHDCPAVSPGDDQSADLRQVVMGVGFFLLIVGSLAAFVWVLGPTGPFTGPEEGAPGPTTTSENAATGRLVLQAVNDVRNEANRSPIGYYEPLADRAANSSWAVPEENDDGVDLGEGATCSRIESLEFEGIVQPGRSATEAEAVVATWDGNQSTRQVLLAEEWDLGGASVERVDGTLRVRLLVCNSTG